MSEHLDFNERITAENHKIPMCHTELISSLRALEHLPGVAGDGDMEIGMPKASSQLFQLEHVRLRVFVNKIIFCSIKSDVAYNQADETEMVSTEFSSASLLKIRLFL